MASWRARAAIRFWKHSGARSICLRTESIMGCGPRPAIDSSSLLRISRSSTPAESGRACSLTRDGGACGRARAPGSAKISAPARTAHPCAASVNPHVRLRSSRRAGRLRRIRRGSLRFSVMHGPAQFCDRLQRGSAKLSNDSATWRAFEAGGRPSSCDKRRAPRRPMRRTRRSPRLRCAQNALGITLLLS